jgi:hypothetical protein
MKNNIYINILTPFKDETFMRQLSSSIAEEGFLFFENSLQERVWDMVIVYEGLNRELTVKCKKGSLVFISGEPPFSRKYASKFLNQFDHLITAHPKIKHSNNHLSQQALPWHFGLSFKTKKFNFSFDDLVAMPVPEKNNKISIITSNKKMMPGHKQRMVFLEALKNKFGNQIAVFGQGINPVDDKAEALLSYQFCICIENSGINDYWTEKIADSLLSYCVPIYYGCKNIRDYFNESSLIKIDIDNLEFSIKVIENVLLNADKIYSEKLEQLKIERDKVLHEYNLFSVLVDFYKKSLNNYDAVEKYRNIQPSENFNEHHIKMNLLRLKRFIYRLS